MGLQAAPPRFLPQFDNVLLGHSDRSRFIAPGLVPGVGGGNLLVDGLLSGWWKTGRSDERPQMEIGLVREVSAADLEAVSEEAERLFRFAHPDGDDGDVVIGREW